jgi:toxin ParE1/3/4
VIYLIEYSGPARRDLRAVERYLRAEAGDAIADRFIRDIVTKVDSLRDMPARQRRRAKLRPELRAVSISQYMIFYCIEGDRVRIIRVLHGSRNITTKKFPREFRKP